MTPDIETAVQFALEQTGKPYQAYGARMGLDRYDCSGLVFRALSEAGVPLPPGISVENCYGNTVSLYRWAVSSGGLVSVEAGVRTRGAIMIRGKWYGNGPLGHTSISLGDGTEMAAHGYRSGIHPSPIYGGQNYQDAFIIPGVHYAALDPPVDPKVLEALAALNAWKKRVSDHPLHEGNNRPLDTRTLNELLVHRALLDAKFKTSKVYGPDTSKAVLRLKRRNGIHPFDGTKFGSRAAAALLKPPGT